MKKQENAEFERLIREQKKSDAFQRKLFETQQFLRKQEENERKIEEKQRFLQETRKEQADYKEKLRKEKTEIIEHKLLEIFHEKENKAKSREFERLEKARKMKQVFSNKKY